MKGMLVPTSPWTSLKNQPTFMASGASIAILLTDGTVFYGRTHDHSSMAVASHAEVSTHVEVSTEQELGPSILQVVANGIASSPVFVMVRQHDE